MILTQEETITLVVAIRELVQRLPSGALHHVEEAIAARRIVLRRECSSCGERLPAEGYCISCFEEFGFGHGGHE